MLAHIKFFKILPHARIPTQATEGSTGFDLYSNMEYTLKRNETRIIFTGIGVECVEPVVDIQVRGRSSLSSQGILTHIGTVDADYRGEIGVILTNLNRDKDHAYQINIGDRIGQLIFLPRVEKFLIEVAEYVDIRPTIRGTAGFGFTGK